MTEVVAALIWRENKFMICRRPAHKARGLLWEFVGGKAEDGESLEQALIRECKEELCILLSVGEKFMEVTHEYPDVTVHLTLFNATIKEGTPILIEHSDLKWITPDEIGQYEFCPADEEILKEIIKKAQRGIYAPSYYNDFLCIADRCSHSCCIDWEIRIDSEAYEKYKQFDDIMRTVRLCEDGPCFELCKDGRCPHLNEAGLCNIILTHGEEYLSEICDNHPRFFNRISGERIEAGYGIVCEEACRLILENDRPFSLSKTEDLPLDISDDETADGEMHFDALPTRDYIISVIEAPEGSYCDKTEALKKEFKICDPYTPDKWLDRFLSLEILDENWEKDLRSMRGKLLAEDKQRVEKYGKYYERLLTYFVYRHVSVADSEYNLCARLGFCVLSVNVIRSLFENSASQDLDTLVDVSRRYSAEIEYSEDNTDELIFAFESGYLC